MMEYWTNLIWIVLTITIILILVGGVFALLSYYVFESYGGFIVSFLAFFAGIAFGLPASAVSVTYYNRAKTEYNTHVVDILSLDRDTGVYGRFCLGTGTVEDKPIYYYYYKVKENTYKLGKINCNECYIIETDNTPCIWEIKEKGKIDPYYNIYVPFGTVIVNYTA